MYSFSKIIAVAVGTTFFAAAAQASGQAETKKQVVSYADLDLTNPDGMEMLKVRLKAAAAKVCGPQPDMHEPYAGQVYQYCTTKALYDALKIVSAQTESVQNERIAQGR